MTSGISMRPFLVCFGTLGFTKNLPDPLKKLWPCPLPPGFYEGEGVLTETNPAGQFPLSQSLPDSGDFDFQTDRSGSFVLFRFNTHVPMLEYERSV